MRSPGGRLQSSSWAQTVYGLPLPTHPYEPHAQTVKDITAEKNGGRSVMQWTSEFLKNMSVFAKYPQHLFTAHRLC